MSFLPAAPALLPLGPGNVLFSESMRAIVVRHYKTLLNESGQILGWGDAPRAKDWIQDLEYVDQQLHRKKIRFDRVYSSDLGRARRTAMFFAQSHGIHIVHDSHELKEINYGALYRKSKQWVEENIPEHKKDPDFIYPEGESFRQMQQRSVDFLLSVSRKFPDYTILVVVHAGVIRGLVSHFLELDYASNLRQKITHRYIGEFLIEDDRCKYYNEHGKTSGFVRDGTVKIPWPARNHHTGTAG